MRYVIVLIGLIVFACKTTKIGGQANHPGSFVILIQYRDAEVETSVIHVLNLMTSMQHFEIRHGNVLDAIEATCESLKDSKIHILVENIKQTSGVFNVIVNPRY